MEDKYYKQTKKEMIQDYLDSIKKEDPEEELEPKPETPRRIRDIIFPNSTYLNIKNLIISLGIILIIYILVLIFFPTQSATPKFDEYHEENKHLIDRKNFFDHGEYLKSEEKEKSN